MMKETTIVSNIQCFFPIAIDETIISEDELSASYKEYLKLKKTTSATIPMFFYDWIELAANGQEKAKAFLSFCHTKIKHLWDTQCLDGNSLKKKIHDSILTMSKNGYPSYRDSLSELLLFDHLSGINNYKCLGIDFKIGNGKDSDIAFKNGNHIQLIEITNIHHLTGKNIIKMLKNRVEEKLKDKTKHKEEVEKYFSCLYPNTNVYISILPFIWAEPFDIAAESSEINSVLKMKGDDLLPPMTLLCEQNAKSMKYSYQLSNLSYVLDKIKELNQAKL